LSGRRTLRPVHHISGACRSVKYFFGLSGSRQSIILAGLYGSSRMTAARLLSEQDFHDAQAAERARRFADLASLRFRDNEYLDHETWIGPAFDMLGDLRGKTTLDYGCGHGMASIVMARRGA